MIVGNNKPFYITGILLQLVRGLVLFKYNRPCV